MLQVLQTSTLVLRYKFKGDRYLSGQPCFVFSVPNSATVALLGAIEHTKTWSMAGMHRLLVAVILTCACSCVWAASTTNKHTTSAPKRHTEPKTRTHAQPTGAPRPVKAPSPAAPFRSLTAMSLGEQVFPESPSTDIYNLTVANTVTDWNMVSFPSTFLTHVRPPIIPVLSLVRDQSRPIVRDHWVSSDRSDRLCFLMPGFEGRCMDDRC